MSTERPFKKTILEQFNRYLININNLNTEGIKEDVSVLLQLIYFKYSGEEVFTVIKEMAKSAQDRYTNN